MWRRLAAHLALVAIALQVLVIQPHVEPSAIAFHGGSDAAQHSITAQADVHAQAAACIICQAGISGRTVLGAAAISAPFELHVLRVAALLPDAPGLPATPSHAWRSRGPPSLV